jgi:hypothetical protein
VPGITRHRRHTRNHTWHADFAGRALFLKASPDPAEARAEHAGHARVRGFYPVPPLRAALRAGPWTLTAYDRWPPPGHAGTLLLDQVTRAGQEGGTTSLDACLTSLITHYREVIGNTARQARNRETITKLYGDRAAPGGRLDAYYSADKPLQVGDSPQALRPSQLSGMPVIVNGCEYAVDFAGLITWCRERLAPEQPVWGAILQGDPTDLNIGWSPSAGPVWFDYDTAGLNALPGEFACFLIYQRLHGAWLTPRCNPAAFRDHPGALAAASATPPAVRAAVTARTLRIDYSHNPGPARRHILGRYLNEVVLPVAGTLGISDPASWLRPYLAMRLLAVYNLTSLHPADTALSLALLAQALDPGTPLETLLALTP